MMDSGPTAFAFYGTLMEGHHRGSLLGHLGAYEGGCLIEGTLYDVGSFPALVANDASVVLGQVWRPFEGCEEEALARLDGIEGYRADDPAGSLYLRKQVRLLDPCCEEVWTYVWNRGMGGLTPIFSGSWTEHREAQRAWHRSAA